MVNWLKKSVFSAIIREFVFSESLDLSWLVLTVGVLEVLKSLGIILVGFNSWGFGRIL